MISTPHIQGILGYLIAWYHGLPVHLLLSTSHFTWKTTMSR